MKLRISDDLVLGADYVVSTAGIFASKGQGKSHLAQRSAEEMLANGQVIVAIDPTDVWWGLRAGADGRSDGGYPVVVVGGNHCDIKLEPGGAVQLAEAVVAERFSCVICTKGLTDMTEARFVREFLDTIYRKNREALHIFVDEADIFAPQKPFDPEDARCIRAMSHIVRRGRTNGIGTTLITQRPAELNASVRSQVEMLFVLGMLNNLDIEAVEKWMRLRKKKRGSNSAFELQEEMIESLDTLQKGDAWAWAPRLGIHKRFRASAKRTFDSGATPKPGKKLKAPKKLAPVDLQRLGQAMTAAVQRQKENDPAELRKQIAALRRQAEGGEAVATKTREVAALQKEIEALKRSAAVPVKAKPVVREIAVVRSADLRRMEAIEKRIDKLVTRVAGESSDLRGVMDRMTKFRDQQLAGLKPEPAVEQVRPVVVPSLMRPAKAAKPARVVKDSPVANGHAVSPPEGLKPAHLRLLTAIAWWESLGVPAPDLGGVAFAAKTSTTSSSFDNNRSRLRAAGYIEYPSSGCVRLTDAGRAIAPPPVLEPTNEALQGAILSEVSPAMGRLLSALIAAYPDELSLEDFAKQAGTSTSSSSFDNNRSWLRARGLAEYPRTGFVRATKLLFPEGAA